MYCKIFHQMIRFYSKMQKIYLIFSVNQKSMQENHFYSFFPIRRINIFFIKWPLILIKFCLHSYQKHKYIKYMGTAAMLSLFWFGLFWFAHCQFQFLSVEQITDQSAIIRIHASAASEYILIGTSVSVHIYTRSTNQFSLLQQIAVSSLIDLQISADGEWIVLSEFSTSSLVYKKESQTYELYQTLDSQNFANSLHMIPNHNWLLIGRSDGLIDFYQFDQETEQYEEAFSLSPGAKAIFRVKISQNQEIVVGGEMGPNVYVYRKVDGVFELFQVLEHQGEDFNFIDVTGDGSFIYVARSQSSSVIVYNSVEGGEYTKKQQWNEQGETLNLDCSEDGEYVLLNTYQQGQTSQKSYLYKYNSEKYLISQEFQVNLECNTAILDVGREYLFRGCENNLIIYTDPDSPGFIPVVVDDTQMKNQTTDETKNETSNETLNETSNETSNQTIPGNQTLTEEEAQVLIISWVIPAIVLTVIIIIVFSVLLYYNLQIKKIAHGKWGDDEQKPTTQTKINSQAV